VNRERLLKASARLGEAAIDPRVWPEIMEQISGAAGARGAVLLQGVSRTPDVPRTAGVDEFVDSYFAEGWHARDIRAERAVPLLLGGRKVVTDHDILAPEEMERAGLYSESLIPHGLRWFAGIGFWAGPALWGLTIQRTDREGPFSHQDKRLLAQLSQRLSEAGTLSYAVGQLVVAGMTNALQLVRQAALALDRSGVVLDVNQAAEQLFDDEIRVGNRRLLLRDKKARSALHAFVDQMRTAPDSETLSIAPIVVHRRRKRPLIISVLPVDGPARTPFLGARALLALSDLELETKPQPTAVARAFGLSPAETMLASLLASGLSPRQAAEELGVTYETARTQLKAVFAKTGVHRQAELVALLKRPAP
jgi:DNA-binding CsgD family transcriptional regulator/PAS domain-containing protein